MINPRGPEFASLLAECLVGVRWGLQTANRILFFPSSGTGGLEAVVANLLSPGERAVFCTVGWFGELWADIAERYGVDVVRVCAPWGEAIERRHLDHVLDRESSVTKVFLTHCETSTGVLNDVPALAAVAQRHGCLVAVDSISGVPCHPLPVDALGLDIVITASQKGWLAPPGLTMVAVSDAAMQAAAHACCPRVYFDFGRQASAQDNDVFHTTPPLSVMYGLAEGLQILREEGLQEIWERHARVGRRARRGLQNLGLELICAGPSPSNTVSAVRSPYPNPGDLSALVTCRGKSHC
jgi:aspartate aminotransferase-like enzyme